MTMWTFLSSLMTVVSLATFIGIVVWAYNRNRKPSFDEAANAPFALPDDAQPVNSNERRGGHAA